MSDNVTPPDGYVPEPPTEPPLTVKMLQDAREKMRSIEKRWQADNLHLLRIVEECKDKGK